MLPIVLNPAIARVGLAGLGEGLSRRKEALWAAGIAPLSIAADAGAEALRDLQVLFVTGLSPQQSTRLARAARAAGVLVNVEDQPALCDFHMPAVVRRGDLLVTVSTGGKAPGLARLVREWIERRLGLEWAGHLEDIARARAAWKLEGRSLGEVSQKTRDYVRDRELLP